MPATAPNRPARPFAALQYRDFRLIWGGLILSSVGTWMQIVALSLLVLDLTHGSAFALGVVSLSQALAFLIFTPIGGGFADRVNRRSLLLVTQCLLAGLAIFLGFLTSRGIIRFWMIPAITFTSGAILSFDQPARNALVASLVPKDALMAALSLQSAVFNGASVLGPALAGLALSRIGYAGNFYLNAISYSAVIAALAMLRHTPLSDAGRRGSLFNSVRDALQYVARDSILPATVAAFGGLLFFGPSTAIALPVFARQIAHLGATQLGILFAASGAGTVAGAMIAASLSGHPAKHRLEFVSILIWSGALAALALSSRLLTAVVPLVIMGASQNVAGAAAMTLLQSRVPPEMRGRAMSVNTLLVMCVRPLGDFPVAGLIGLAGFRPAMLACAGVVAAIVVALPWRRA
ncbi:MAG TPA: MFS transporter [Bryobacteraceae bacterium]